jgi:hypothetical protein
MKIKMPESKKLKVDPAMSFLSIYLKECKSAYRGTCTLMFIATLLTIAKLWNQPRCPRADEWIKRMCYMYTMEYYSSIKRMKLFICRK